MASPGKPKKVSESLLTFIEPVLGKDAFTLPGVFPPKRRPCDIPASSP